MVRTFQKRLKNLSKMKSRPIRTPFMMTSRRMKQTLLLQAIWIVIIERWKADRAGHHQDQVMMALHIANLLPGAAPSHALVVSVSRLRIAITKKRVREAVDLMMPNQCPPPHHTPTLLHWEVWPKRGRPGPGIKSTDILVGLSQLHPGVAVGE